MSRCGRTLIALAAIVCSGFAFVGTASAAEFQVVPLAVNASDVTCAPCRTIQAAVAKAARTPGRDSVLLGGGTFNESVTILDEDSVGLFGRGLATVIAGRITIGLPARGRAGNALSYNGFARDVRLSSLSVRSADAAISAQNIDVALTDTSIQGAIRLTNGTLRGDRNAIATTGCGPTLSFAGSTLFTDANGQEWMGNGWLERSMVTGAVPLQSTMVGATGFVHSFITAAQGGCASASAITGSGASARVYAYDSVINAVGTPLAAFEGAGGANVELSSVTIVGAFQRGVRVSRAAWAKVDATAIDGPPIALDSSLGGRLVTRWVMASGTGTTSANDAIRETTYRATLRLSRDVGYPELESPVVNGIRTNVGELQIFPPGMHTDVVGTVRPQAAFIGGPAVYDIGAWERTPEPLPLNGLPVGPGWVGVGLIPDGGLGVDVGGIGFPRNPNVPEIGTPGSGPESAAPATVAIGPILQITVPKRARQGAVVRVYVRAPYQGRLTLRVYGAKGKLINVARGRKINRGTRVVELRLGPNARIGDARVTAVLTRPKRPVLRDVETMRVVRRAR